MVQHLEHFSSPSAPLEAVLSAFPGGVPETGALPLAPIVTSRQWFGNGAVLRAVREIMASTSEAVSIAQVHALAQEELGKAVSVETVRSCLARNAWGPAARLMRVGVGWYRLAGATGG